MSNAVEAACPSCGHVNSPDAQFCAECGAILPPQKGERAAAPSEPSPGWQQAGEPPHSPVRRWRGVIVAAAVALVVLTGILIAVQRHRGSGLISVRGATPKEATPTSVPTPTVPAQPTPTIPSPTAPAHNERAGAGERPRRTPAPRAEPTEPPAARAVPGWYRVRYRAPLFREPSETSEVIAYLPAGSKVHVTRVLPGFLAVESVTGKPPGYLSSDDASPESAP